MIPALINLIVWLLIVGILYALVVWVIDSIPIPQPANRMIKIVLVVLIALVIILLLLDLVGMGGGGIDLPKIAT